MKVVLTTDTTHTIRLIPRFSPLGAIVVTLRNEFTEAVSEPSNSFVLSNGYLSVTFEPYLPRKGQVSVYSIRR